MYKVPVCKKLSLWPKVPKIWVIISLCIILLIIAPILSVVIIALEPITTSTTSTIKLWKHLLATVFPRYLGNTLYLMAGVSILTSLFGTVSAWLIVMYQFPGKRWLEYALLFPLAIPAYIGAYSLVDFLQYSGPVQSGLRAIMGWESVKDYWFPEVRSREMAILVLSSALYPYVYLLTRAALKEQSGCAYEVARTLGCSKWALFWRVGVPLARPAIFAGVALALMETIADYGAVSYFSVQTLTTGIFSTWLNRDSAAGAAQIACLILVMVFALTSIERRTRKKARFHRGSRSSRPLVCEQLKPATAWYATLFCLLPFFFGFILPIGVMMSHGLSSKAYETWASWGLLRAVWHSLSLGVAASLVTVFLALVLVYGALLLQKKLGSFILSITSLGYAVPGAVLAIGILIPLAYLDHWLADGVFTLTGWDPGLLLTGTVGALVLAYTIRFFGVAQNSIQTAFGRISPSMPMAARSLGKTAHGTLRQVHFPLIRKSIVTALIIVFVDCIKELPATLLLRPFNYNTLSTQVFELASLEKLPEAAPAALIVIIVGLSAVALLVKENKPEHF